MSLGGAVQGAAGGGVRRRAAAEIAQIDTVRDDYADRIAVVPLLPVEPVGIPALRALTDARPAAAADRNPAVAQ